MTATLFPAFEELAKDCDLDATAINELTEDDGRRVFDYYVALLANRKMFGRICADRLRNSNNPNPTRTQIRNSLVSQCDPSCWIRACDYLDRPEDPHVFDDEQLIVDAFFKAVCNGRETILLTRRRELVDQFWTLAKTLESHYRAWAISQSEADFFQKIDFEDSGPLGDFKSNLQLASFAKGLADKALPKHGLEIGVQVWLIDGEFGDRLRIYPAGFPVEPAMAYMFQNKNENKFRSACGLDALNVHFQWARTEERGTFAQCLGRC